MGQTTDQVESHIESTREDLKTNLQELEGRVRSATDWRHYVNQNPGMMIAAAFGGGVLLSALLKKRRSAPHRSVSSSTRFSGAARAPQTRTKNGVLDKLDTIKTALVGAAATKFKRMLSEAVPGFSEHLSEVEEERRDARARDEREAREARQPTH
jgi:hypothetical protein